MKAIVMFKNQHISRFFMIIVLSILVTTINARPDNTIPYLQSLDRNSPEVKNLRKDVRDSLYVIKSGRDPMEIPELKFYKYRVEEEDSFWTILARTSLNMDTLITANNLATPRDIAPGATIYIPNMRGIIYRMDKDESISRVAEKFKISKTVLSKVNRIDSQPKTFIFIPCGSLSRLDRSLFLGTAFISPVIKGKRTSDFGMRKDPIQHDKRFHSGIDIACPVGTRIRAARNGKVIFTGYRGGYGKLVIISHSRNYYTYYGHLSKILVKKGANVTSGHIIAISGNTGRTTGPHLHFEVRKHKKPVDPGLLLH